MATPVDLTFIDEMEELTAIPSVAMDLMSMLNNPSLNVNQIVEKIKLDTALAAFVLKYCNSPLLGIRTQVNSISHAINLIGIGTCKSIFMSYFFRNLYNISGKKYITDLLWEHSILVAFIARELALRLNLGGKEEEAYLAGLLHDIGKLVIYYFDKDNYETLMQKAYRERKSFLPLEKDIYGYTHVETGYYLISKWKFSNILKDSILFHHNFFKYSGKESVVSLVTFANETVHFAIEKQGEKPDMFLKFYRLSEEKYSKMTEEIYEIVKGSQFLHLD